MKEPIETPEETIKRLENVEVMLADDNERLRKEVDRINSKIDRLLGLDDDYPYFS